MKYGQERDVKLYYSISEVCEMCNLEKHVLRYWESEFSQLSPRKNRAGNRTYRSKEIELIKTIQFLLHEEKYTVEGARRQLKRWRDGDTKKSFCEGHYQNPEPATGKQQVLSDLKGVLSMLQGEKKS